MMVVSGTTSQVSGGKFANGAVTGAFIHMYNANGDILKEALSIKKMWGVFSSVFENSEKLNIGLELAEIQQKGNLNFERQLSKYDMIYDSSKYLKVMKMQDKWNKQMEIIRHNYAISRKLNIKPLFKERE